MSTIKVDELRALSDNNFRINLEGNDNLIIAGNIEMDNGATFSIPVGTTAQRPSSPVSGMIRYNTTESQLEYYDSSNWRKFVGSSTTATGTTQGSALNSVQELYDIGHQADGLYWLNLDGTARQYYVPLQSHPYYIMMGNWGGGASKFFSGSDAGSLTGRELNGQGDLTPEGNWANNGTYGYYRSAGGSDFRYATMNRRGISYRYVKFKFNLYNYYSNDGVNGRSFLGLGGVGDGLTLMRDNSGDGDGQHIFTYFTALSNQDGNSCPSSTGYYPSHRRQGNNPSGFISNRFTCWSREGNGYTSEYVRNFTPFAGDNGGGTKPNVYNGDVWYTVDMGQNYSHNMHCVIHSDQDSGNEDTYLKRGVVLVRPE